MGRLYSVSHHNQELYALRQLLSVVRGPTSFVDMATFDGVIYETFQLACHARGLMSDDSELIATMQEIIEVTVSVDHIRQHFASLLVHSAPRDPLGLFNVFVDDLCEEVDGQPDIAAALLGIEVFMQNMGRSLCDADFGFKLPDTQQQPSSKRRRRDPSVSVPESVRLRDELLHKFTAEQHAALATVVDRVTTPQHCNAFAVIASAGCGKTVFANGLASYFRAQGREVACVAASALAAMLLVGGSTAHSAFRIPIPANEGSMCNVSREERAALKRVELIIYDECSMVHADVANTVERTLRDIMHDERPFGGKIFVWTGDFKQLLPVVRFGKGHNFTIQTCAWWSSVHKIKFSKNWRAALNPVYTAFLEDVGNGRVEKVVVPAPCRVDSYAVLIDRVYGDTFPNGHQILALTLETCAEINALCFDKLPGEMTESPAADVYVDCSDRDAFPPDYIATLPIKGAPPWMLQFKPGARYMCIRNIDPARGLINGTMLQLLAVGRRYIQVQILTGKSAGSCSLLFKTVFTISSEASGVPFTIVRTQYPIIPAYCLSVHKAQGQSLIMVGLVFESDPFTHGQLYTALSRVGGWDSVVAIHQGDDIHNVVLKHLLSY